MSWFTSGLEALHQLSETVQKAIPMDKELLAKLTLNTDEMKAERQQFGEEAKRKMEVKNMLSGMLPWETRDSERDILVEECKEAILALSARPETFYGPYEMPSLKVKLNEDNEKVEGDDPNDDEEELEGAENRFTPSEESLEKLAKLEPLPPLLRDFDLDSHVGLIEKLLKEDPSLQERQSTLSGGGLREKVFWQNYFFHCAYTRYEAGLSIDEIWSFRHDEDNDAGKEDGKQTEDTLVEELVVFGVEEGDAGSVDPAFVPDETSSGEPQSEVVSETPPFDSTEGSPSGSAASEFEMLDSGEGEVTASDPELDELEAEIARELED